MTSGGGSAQAPRPCAGLLLPLLFFLYISGILAGRAIVPDRLPFVGAGLIAAAAGAVIGILRRRRPVALAGIALFFLLAGMHRPFGFFPPDDPLHIYNRIGNGKELSLIGRVDELIQNTAEHQRIRMTLEAVVDGNRLTPAIGRVQLSRPRPAARQVPAMFPGDRLIARARLRPLPNTGNPAGANFSIFLARNDIWVTGWIPAEGYLAPLPPIDDHRRSYPLERLREVIGKRMDAAFAAAPVRAAIYRALILGDRSSVPPELSEVFKQSGLAHLLAISGLHLGMLGVFAFAACHWLLRRSTRIILALPWPVWKLALAFSFLILCGYALVAGMKPPVQRSLIMAGFITLALLGNRRWSMTSALFCAAFAIVLLEPNSLSDVSFQLTFCAMIGIAAFLPEIAALAASSRLPRFGGRIASGLLISTAAMAGTLPILLYHFNRFSPLSPLSTLLVSPLIGFVILPLGLLACLLLPIPVASTLLFKAGGAALPIVQAIAVFFARLPASSLWAPSPPPWAIAFFLAALICPLLAPGRPRLRIASLSLALLVFPITVLFLGPDRPEDTEITFLNVGAGSSAIVAMPEKIHILIDGGSSPRPPGDPGRDIIAPALWRQGIRKLTGIVVTHPDADHYNGLDFIVEHFAPTWLWTSSTEGGPAYRLLLAHATAAGTRVVVPRAGDILAAGGNGMLRVLAKGDSPLHVSNDSGLLVQVIGRGGKALFPGDMSRQAQESVLESGIAVDSDLLLLPHHGREDSRSEAFLQAVSPDHIVVSSADRDLAAELAPHLPSPLSSTAEQGAIRARFGKKGLRVEPCCQPFPRKKFIR